MVGRIPQRLKHVAEGRLAWCSSGTQLVRNEDVLEGVLAEVSKIMEKLQYVSKHQNNKDFGTNEENKREISRKA